MSSIKFSIETYFVWFSALIFITEFITDVCLVIYYFHQHEMRWGLVTLTIIILPLMMCQLYSLALLKKHIGFSILIIHLLLMGIPYRYYNILRRVDIEKVTPLHQQMIKDVKNLQILNAIFQYCPQFIFQAFLIVYQNYKCIITGVSAGLAGFSFIWHIFLYFYYFVKQFNQKDDVINIATTTTTTATSIHERNQQQQQQQLNDNLSSGTISKTYQKSQQSSGATNLTPENIKIFEKPMYNLDDKNFLTPKRQQHDGKCSKIFYFNKRKAMYETATNCDSLHNASTIFYEMNDSNNSLTIAPIKLNTSIASTKTEDFHNENNTNLVMNSKKYQEIPNFCNDALIHENMDFNKMKFTSNNNNNGGGGGSSMLNTESTTITENRVLKRKGICSSQEMLHLVDIMNDIPPEEIDMLAKSLIEMGGDDSLVSDNPDIEADNSKLLENFPEFLDDKKILENIDAAIYENQIIFEERIKKNQLTIQNLKLQDQLLSKYIEEIKNLPSTELINIRDYENMCFANVSRTNRLKHWRNYLQDINSSLHDNSTVQNSSLFYVNTNTLSNSLTDLYVNGTDIGSVVTEDGKLSDQISLPLSAVSDGGYAHSSHSHHLLHHHHHHVPPPKKCVRWSEKLSMQDHQQQRQQQQMQNPLKIIDDDDDDDVIKHCIMTNGGSDNLYININGPNINAPHKNILVETINAINDVESPVISHLNKKKITK